MFRSRTVRGVSLAVVLAALCGFSKQGQAGLIVPGTQAQHIALGSDPKFQANGWLSGIDQLDQFNIAGNFVLTSPTRAIAPAHVVDGLTSPWKSLYASFSNHIYNEAPNYIQVSSWEIYPGYVDDNGAGTSDDIAILNFSNPIEGIIPAEVYWGNLLEGLEIEFAGVGYQQEWGSLTQTFSGQFWGGKNRIDQIGSVPLGIESQFFIADFGPASGTAHSSDEMGLRQFYSGTGTYATINGQFQLVGLGAFGFGNEKTGFIRPAMYQDFIVQSVPEPSTFLLSLVAVPFVMLMKRHKKRRNHA